jgi:hypothetical protein
MGNGLSHDILSGSVGGPRGTVRIGHVRRWTTDTQDIKSSHLVSCALIPEEVLCGHGDHRSRLVAAVHCMRSCGRSSVPPEGRLHEEFEGRRVVGHTT